MTFNELEHIATLLYGSHWKQQVIADFSGRHSMLSNWKQQGVPGYVKGRLELIARQRVLDTEKAVRMLAPTE